MLGFRSRGYTLVELLIVSLIISMIVAIAIPTLWATRIQAQIGGTKSTLRTIYTAEQAFLTRYSTFGEITELRNAGFLDSRFENDPVIENGYSTTIVLTNGGNGFICTSTPSDPSAPMLSIDETGLLNEV